MTNMTAIPTDEATAGRFDSCPACSGPTLVPFEKHVSDYDAPKTWRDFFYGAREMLGAMSQCADCGFHYLEAPSAQADDFYRAADATDYFNLEKQRVDYFRKVRRDAVKRDPELANIDTVVDFGCAAGNWLEVFPDSLDRIGIELNEDFDPVLSRKGLRRISDYDEIDSIDPLWVTAFDFVEHMTDPLGFLEFLAGKPRADANSYLFGVPDLGRVWAKLLGSKYYLYCPMHFNYFDETSLKLICETAFPNHDVQVYNSPIMFTNLKGALKWVAPKYADTPIGKVDLPLGYRANVMALVTPKQG